MATWTSLTYSFGSTLTSTKMTQNQDNFLALAEGASGAPSIQTAALANSAVTTAKIADANVTNSKLATNSVDSAQLVASSVTQIKIATANVGQAQLKTTTASGNQALGGGAQNSYTLTGGTYSWWTAGSTYTGFSIGFGNSDVAAGVIGIANLDASAGNTFYVDERYVQSSPPYRLGPLFVYLLINPDGSYNSIRVSQDPPWAYWGPTDIRPQYYRDGKPYRMVESIDGLPIRTAMKSADVLQRMVAEEIEIAKVEQEITIEYKDSDMAIVPHLFSANTLAGRTVAMIDPGSRIIDALNLLLENENAGEVRKLIEANYLIVDSSPIALPNSPPGVSILRARWKLS